MKKRKLPRYYACGYCGRIGPTSEDHVPAKCFFLDDRPKSLIKIKACSKCHNTQTSKDDEYVHHLFLAYFRVADLTHVQPLIDKMFKAAAMPEKRKYAEATLMKFTEVEAETFGGISVGKQPALRIDRSRINRVLTRYVKGLCRHIAGRRVQDNQTVRIIFNPEAIINEKAILSTSLHPI